jgi:PmbA protein
MTQDDALTLLTDLIEKARKAGADAADAVYVEGVSLSHAQRLGAIEKLERSEAQDLGLRVLIGQRQAMVSSTDHSPQALAELVERAVAMARVVPEDPYIGLAESKLLAHDLPDLDLLDPAEPTPAALIERAKAAEDAARAVEGVTNSEGAEAGWSRRLIALATSGGFTGGYAASSHSVAASVIAGAGLAMERDHDWASAAHGGDLDDPAAVGRRAGEKAVRRLGPRKAKSARVPVVYDPRVAGGLLGHLAGAINGAAIARGTSFLRNKMDSLVFPEAITIVDDPHRARGLRSKPFDGEGVANRRRAVIDRGRLTTWLLDSRSARQLGLASTGHAARGTSSPPMPSATNLYLEPGGVTPHELMEDIDSGFYVTELIGFGINGITGDYSRGAAGFWIEGGQLAYPVSEVTVAGNLIEMFKNLSAANDLVFRYGTDAPTLRIDGMTVAGT